MAKKINLTVFKKFFHSGKVGGIILLICVIISLIIANTNAAVEFANFLARTIGFQIGSDSEYLPDFFTGQIVDRNQVFK